MNGRYLSYLAAIAMMATIERGGVLPDSRALACDTGTQLSGGGKGAPRHDRQRLLIAREADGVASGSRGLVMPRANEQTPQTQSPQFVVSIIKTVRGFRMYRRYAVYSYCVAVSAALCQQMRAEQRQRNWRHTEASFRHRRAHQSGDTGSTRAPVSERGSANRRCQLARNDVPRS